MHNNTTTRRAELLHIQCGQVSGGKVELLLLMPGETERAEIQIGGTNEGMRDRRIVVIIVVNLQQSEHRLSVRVSREKAGREREASETRDKDLAKEREREREPVLPENQGNDDTEKNTHTPGERKKRSGKSMKMTNMTPEK